jgi:hypothetical protein
MCARWRQLVAKRGNVASVLFGAKSMRLNFRPSKVFGAH